MCICMTSLALWSHKGYFYLPAPQPHPVQSCSRQGRSGGQGERGPATLLRKMSTSPLLWGPGRPQLNTTGRRLVEEVGRTGTSSFPMVGQGSPPGRGRGGPISAQQAGALGPGG